MPALAHRYTPHTPDDWRQWSAYLAELPTNAERAAWIAAYSRAADILSDSDPMWAYAPHEWTARDIEIHVDRVAASRR